MKHASKPHFISSQTQITSSTLFSRKSFLIWFVSYTLKHESVVQQFVSVLVLLVLQQRTDMFQENRGNMFLFHTVYKTIWVQISTKTKPHILHHSTSAPVLSRAWFYWNVGGILQALPLVMHPDATLEPSQKHGDYTFSTVSSLRSTFHQFLLFSVCIVLYKWWCLNWDSESSADVSGWPFCPLLDCGCKGGSVRFIWNI